MHNCYDPKAVTVSLQLCTGQVLWTDVEREDWGRTCIVRSMCNA